MELGQNHIRDGLFVPNSIMVLYMDPLGKVLGFLVCQRNHAFFNGALSCVDQITCTLLGTR